MLLSPCLFSFFKSKKSLFYPPMPVARTKVINDICFDLQSKDWRQILYTKDVRGLKFNLKLLRIFQKLACLRLTESLIPEDAVSENRRLFSSIFSFFFDFFFELFRIFFIFVSSANSGCVFREFQIWSSQISYFTVKFLKNNSNPDFC